MNSPPNRRRVSVDSSQGKLENQRRISRDHGSQGRFDIQRQFSQESSLSRQENQRRISVDSSKGKYESQRRISVESAQSDRARRGTMAGPSPRRISGASFFASFKRTPEAVDESNRKKRIENTYRLEPKMRFPERAVRDIITEALGTLSSHQYSPSHSPFLAKLLSARVLENVKQLNIERYKIVCLVTIGSKKRQGLRIASRCLWDEQFDTYVTKCVEGEHFFAVGTVFGVYYE